MTPGVWWVVAGLTLCGAEMLAPGVFLLPIGAAALLAGGLTEWWGLGWPQQVLAFVVLMAASVGAAAWRLRGRTAGDALNGPGAGVIGATCRALRFEGGEGRVSLGDGTWPARMADAEEPAAGAALRVVGLDGTTLVVARSP